MIRYAPEADPTLDTDRARAFQVLAEAVAAGGGATAATAATATQS